MRPTMASERCDGSVTDWNESMADTSTGNSVLPMPARFGCQYEKIRSVRQGW